MRNIKINTCNRVPNDLMMVSSTTFKLSDLAINLRGRSTRKSRRTLNPWGNFWLCPVIASTSEMVPKKIK